MSPSRDKPRDPDAAAAEIAGACVGVRLRRLDRIVTRIYAAELRPHGLTLSQMNVLVAVLRHPGGRPADVGRALAMEKSTVSRTVDRMAQNGWLVAEAGADGRTWKLSATAAGRRLLGEALPAWRRAQAEVSRRLGAAAVRALRDAAGL